LLLVLVLAVALGAAPHAWLCATEDSPGGKLREPNTPQQTASTDQDKPAEETPARSKSGTAPASQPGRASPPEIKRVAMRWRTYDLQGHPEYVVCFWY